MADITFADTTYGLGEAAARRRRASAFNQSQLAMSELGQQTGRQMRDVSQAYRKAAPNQITSFTGRGLGRSGLFREAMQDFAGQQQQQLGDIQQQQLSGQMSIQLQEQQAAQALQDELDRLRLEREQQVMADAAAIKEFAPMTGLFS
jgi:hypothetical protein